MTLHLQTRLRINLSENPTPFSFGSDNFRQSFVPQLTSNSLTPKTGSRQQPDTVDWSRETDWQAGHAAPMLGCWGHDWGRAPLGRVREFLILILRLRLLHKTAIARAGPGKSGVKDLGVLAGRGIRLGNRDSSAMWLRSQTSGQTKEKRAKKKKKQTSENKKQAYYKGKIKMKNPQCT